MAGRRGGGCLAAGWGRGKHGWVGHKSAVDAHIVYQHFLGEYGGGVGVAWPLAADSHVEDQKEGMVVDPFRPGRQGGGRDGVKAVAIHQEVDAIGSPLEGIDMIIIGKLSGRNLERLANAVGASI